jgi:uncharacterized membrane protein YbhN (UPF0104 family)
MNSVTTILPMTLSLRLENRRGDARVAIVTDIASTRTLPPRPGRSALLQAGLLAALLAGVAFVIAGVVPGSGRRVEHADPGWVVAAVLLELMAIAGYALMFHGVFSRGAYRLRFIRSAQIGVGELGAFVVVPTGAGGPALRIWALMRGGMPFPVVMTRSVIHAVVFNLPYVLAAILLGTSVVLGIGSGHAPLAVALAPLGVVAASVALAAVATLIARAREEPPKSRWRRVGWDVVQAIPNGLRELPSRLGQLVLWVGAVGYWAGDCGVLVSAFHAVHGSAPIGAIVLAYMLGQLGNALPLPGGVGGTEPIMLGVMTASGVSLGVGAAAVILYRFVSLGLQAAAGTIAVATLVPALQRSSSSQPGEAAV